MTRNKGFTLVELMVVMAIIAILATAGITQYSKFIKSGRDTARIADLNGLNAELINKGAPFPLTTAANTPAWSTISSSFNLTKAYKDPSTGSTGCLAGTTPADTTTNCKYQYGSCDNGGGFALRAKMESDTKYYTQDKYSGTGNDGFYEVGGCSSGYPAFWTDL